MSKLMHLSRRASLAAWFAPMTPPAGPESMVRTGSRAACSAEIIPPLDCMMRTLPGCWRLIFCRFPLSLM